MLDISFLEWDMEVAGLRAYKLHGYDSSEGSVRRLSGKNCSRENSFSPRWLCRTWKRPMLFWPIGFYLADFLAIFEATTETASS
jgi:hypothetical protein